MLSVETAFLWGGFFLCLVDIILGLMGIIRVWVGFFIYFSFYILLVLIVGACGFLLIGFIANIFADD